MIKMSKNITLVCAVAAMLSALPFSIEASKTSGIGIAANQAHAIIGRPLTPGSVAGVARRTARRHHYNDLHHCVWVNGVHVCR
jgi:hypothetical protein